MSITISRAWRNRILANLIVFGVVGFGWARGHWPPKQVARVVVRQTAITLIDWWFDRLVGPEVR